jgi:ATP-binding cassette, subfamily F, member 3
MLRLENISLTLGARELIGDVAWAVRDDDRIGLVGANGSGKTTLLRVAAREQEVDSGTIQLTRGQTVGYLPQEGVTLRDGSAFEVVKEARSDLVELEARIARTYEELDGLEGARQDQLLARLQRDQDAFTIGGGYTREADAGRMLRGLGFARDRWDRPCSSFSRGWQMRIALARLLMQRPSFMLLDEPTNHLDMESRTWLERYLDVYDGAVVVVSHDRHFLDRVAGRIVEIDAGALTEYRGNYTSYEAMKAAHVQTLSNEQAKQTREVAHLQQFISKFRYDKRRAKQVQSRIRRLEKMDLVQIAARPRRLRFTFPAAPRCGSPVVQTMDLAKSYGDNTVLDGVGFDVERGERVAVAGPNGAGKSTLLRLLANREPPDGGEVRMGHNVLTSYFAQDQLEEMDPELTVAQELGAAVKHVTEERLRAVLGAFLFEGDDIHKPVQVLSGGERNRLALAKILMSGANLLLLDEPTNHLDMASKEVLLDALKEFHGTIVFVSHDRHFVTELGQRVVEVGRGQADLYPGTFEDFLWRKARQMGFEDARVAGVPAPDLWLLGGQPLDKGEDEAPKPKVVSSYRERIRSDRAVERRRRDIDRTMARIEVLEEEVEQIYREMEDPVVAIDHQRILALSADVETRNTEITQLYEQWEALQQSLEDS